MKLKDLLIGGAKGGWGLTKLNLALGFGIPFNKPHGIKVKSLSLHKTETFIPYKRRNWNHIKGTHACAIATVSEFSAGLLLMMNLDADNYRIIMRSISVEYFYQCKMDAVASSEAEGEELQADMVNSLAGNQDGVYKEIETKLHTKDGKHVATAKTLWQIKEWSQVKTKV